MSMPINPRVDIAFKKLFGVEENKDLLISLINAIVSPEDRVVEVTLLNPYNPKNFKNDKLSVLDIKATNQDDKRFNIEIQISDEANYDKRALYYWAKLYTEQLQSGQDYGMLSKAIGIHILNFTSIPGVKKYHNVFHLQEAETKYPFFKDIELHTIELKKFSPETYEKLADVVAKVKTSLDMWSAFLTQNDLLKMHKLPKELSDTNLKKAIDVLAVMNFTPEEREAYEGHLKWLRVEASAIKKAQEDSRAEGLAKGLAEGLAEGLAKGLAEGEKKGEGQKALDIARNLLDVLSDDVISQKTGLSIDEVKSLRH